MRFKIYSPEGHLLYEGEPSYNGAYMKPGTLTFRRICNPTTIPFQVGCYVDYTVKIDGVETRTGYRYFMLTLPQLKKTARPRKAGDAFEYESVVFYDASKVLDFLPFEDLVISDNRQHFSTQESFSTFEAVDGIARRIQSCLDAAYPGLWTVQVASSGVSPEMASLMAEAREFSVSGGISLLGALERIYEVWPEVGWLFEPLPAPDHLEMGGVITIGAPGLAGQDYLYGKGKGLKSIQRAVANEGEIVNRLYAYGSERNLPPRYYNGKDIYLKDSADIRNLMIPIDYWDSEGTPAKPSPLKAYLSSLPSIIVNGLRPKRVYFDGKNDLEEIYPTIKGMTVGDLREYEDEGGVVDYPAGVSWPDSQPLDQIYSVDPDPEGSLSDFDSGLTGENGKVSILKVQHDAIKSGSLQIASSDPTTVTRPILASSYPIWNGDGQEYPNVIARVDLSLFTINFATTLLPTSASLIFVILARSFDDPNNPREIFSKTFNMSISYDGSNYTFKLENPGIFETEVFSVADDEVVFIEPRLVFSKARAGTSGTINWNSTGTVTAEFQRDPLKAFNATIPPFGYDLKDIVATEDTVRIAMTSGPCAGREFVVKKTFMNYHMLIGSWRLTLERQYDESLSQYFPNYYYPIEPNDTFVILGIAMPEVYINAAETRLLSAANKYLQAYSNVMWQYSPEIDSKYMIEQKRRIFPGQYMVIVDYDLVDEAGVGELAYFLDSTGGYFLTENNEKIIVNESGFAVSILVDNITIDEAAGALPSYKVTLRDRKRLKR